mmetsp:Transcript_18473/g.23249  ORF Transcript_18473/g.23249 Transcript_18473/m.23249 type:complete len:380 (+) Transcript_18473:136-1275(+)
MIAIDGGGASFDIGTLVNVQSRTWAGINKPGGVGRVTAFSNDDCTVDVKYVLGGGEKGVDLEFVQQHNFEGDDNGDNDTCRSGRPSRRRRSVESNANNSKGDISNEKQKPPAKKRALKDGSNSANKLKGSEKDQVKKAKLGVKRKAIDAKDEKTTEEANMKKIAKKHKAEKGTEKDQVEKVKLGVMPKAIDTKDGKTKKKDKKAANTKKIAKKKNQTEASTKIAKNKVTPILTQESIPDTRAGSSVEVVKTKATKMSKSNKEKSKGGNELKEKLAPISSSTSKIASSSTANATVQKNAKVASPVTNAPDKKQNKLKISSPTKVLKHVYKDMSDKATSFVNEIVGQREEKGQVKKEATNKSSIPSSPDSTSSLEIQMEEG